jgi:GGDEF domain-containing protein
MHISLRQHLSSLRLQQALRLASKLAFLLVVVWQCAWWPSAHAVPMLDLRSQQTSQINTNLLNAWQSLQLQDDRTAKYTAINPQTVWQWPESQFAQGAAQHPSVQLKAGERWIGRLQLQVTPSSQGLVVDLPMPRLDITHLSYRYDNEPWVHGTAGDQIPMTQWPFAHRNPAFPLPAKAGNLQLVVQIAHEGLMASPVLLQGDPVFRRARFDGALRTGGLLGLALVLSVLGFGAAAVFKRFSFLAVALLTVSVGLAVFAQGGVAGMYVGTETVLFNDVSKFATGMFCAALMPWAVGAVVSQKSYSPWVWRLAIAWLVAGTLAAFLLSGSQMRTAQAAVLPPFLVGALVFVVTMALASVVRGQAHAGWILAAMLGNCMGILTPLLSYWGWIDVSQSFMVSSAGFLLATLLLFYTQLLQYRQGSMVMARAKASAGRDVLTGLLNRRGFEKTLAKIVRQITADKTYAALFYIEVGDAQSDPGNMMDQGFEAGLVQLAAAISISVSVVDTVARVGPSAFAIVVVMPRSAAQATGLAQKIITRAMAIATHGLPMAKTARVAVAWLPLFGTDLTVLERRAQNVLDKLEPGKRIGWVGGVHAHANQADMPGGVLATSTQPQSSQSHGNSLPSIPGIINGLERQIFGADTESIEQKSQRMVQVQRKKSATDRA